MEICITARICCTCFSEYLHLRSIFSEDFAVRLVWFSFSVVSYQRINREPREKKQHLIEPAYVLIFHAHEEMKKLTLDIIVEKCLWHSSGEKKIATDRDVNARSRLLLCSKCKQRAQHFKSDILKISLTRLLVSDYNNWLWIWINKLQMVQFFYYCFHRIKCNPVEKQ